MKRSWLKMVSLLCALILAVCCVPASMADENRTDFNPVQLDQVTCYAKGKYALQHCYWYYDGWDNQYFYALRGSMSVSDGSTYDLYDLNGQYHYFTATVTPGKSDQTPRSNYTAIIRIYGDDRLLFSDEHLTTATRPYEIQLDVRNVMDLKIEMYGQGNIGTDGIRSMLGNPCVLKDDPGFFADSLAAPAAQAYANAVSMDTLSPYAQGKFSLSNDHNVKDLRGNEYRYAIEGYMSPNDGTAYEIYDLNGVYQYLTATVGPMYPRGDSAENRTAAIRIYGDGRLLFSDDQITNRTRPYPIEIYLGHVMDLKIEMYAEGRLWAMLGDPMLLPR